MVKINEKYIGEINDDEYYFTVEYGDDDYDEGNTITEYDWVTLRDAINYVKSQLGSEYYEGEDDEEDIIECYAELKYGQGLGCYVYDIHK